MPIYKLYLESGPKKRTTMVHIPELLGCMANGPTTDAALNATPEAIDRYRRFLARCGEEIDVEAPIETEIAEHITEGSWLGNGSPYISYQPDYDPVTEDDVECYLNRQMRLRTELSQWAMNQANVMLDAKPDKGRTARAILLHVLGSTGGSLSAALGSAKGFSALHGAAERGEIPIPTALVEQAEMTRKRVFEATPEEWNRVRQRPDHDRNLRKAFRHMLEHDWNHLAELSRRPGGPEL